MSNENPGMLKRFYCLIGIAIILYCTYIVYILVMHIWHQEGSHAEKTAHMDNLTENERLYQQMLEGIDKEEADSEYRDISKAHELYSFHNSDIKIKRDSQNYCIDCHGDVPHDEKKEIRSFLNMHAFFLACETCHINIENAEDKKFVWYNKVTGEQQNRIQIDSYLGDTLDKLLVLRKEGDTFIPYSTPQMKKYISEFNSNVASMSPSAKSAGLKIIHRPMSEKPVQCDSCHTTSINEAYIPLEEVGYPEHRIARILGNEVVGMIEKYEKFYIPGFLKPVEEE